MSKPVLRLVYRSRSTLHPENTAELDKIFKKSLANNRRDSLSGCLAHPDGQFVQVIEGESQKVESLMRRLSDDNRHTDITVLGRWMNPSKLFAGWTMVRPDLTPLHQQALKIINERGTGSQIVAILLLMAEQSAGFYTLL